MKIEETIAYFKECNERLVSVAKDENVYDYEKQVIEADCMRETFEANEKAIQALEQTRWISVSERLPNDEQRVLVTIRSGNLINVDTCIFHHASAFWEHYVIAWMPFPEKYEEVGNE